MENSNIIISVIVVLCIAAGVTAYGLTNGSNNVFSDLAGFTPSGTGDNGLGNNSTNVTNSSGSGSGNGTADNGGSGSGSGSGSGTVSGDGSGSGSGGNSGSTVSTSSSKKTTSNGGSNSNTQKPSINPDTQNTPTEAQKLAAAQKAVPGGKLIHSYGNGRFTFEVQNYNEVTDGNDDVSTSGTSYITVYVNNKLIVSFE